MGPTVGQRGTTEFLVQTGDDTGRVVDLEGGTIDTVLDLGAELAGGGWDAVSDPAGAAVARRRVAESEARWRAKAGVVSDIRLDTEPRK